MEGQFGAYRIEGLLGRGGMGEVYRAYDTEHRRTVALKVLSAGLAGDTAYRERFRREAHAAARLSEPHVVPIHRYGEVDGRLFLDMRLVDGTDLGDLLHRDGAMEPARAVSVVGQVARALDAAHAEGLVHRDVKPSNVLVTGSGDDEFVYLVDFGIAWSADATEGPSLTATGSALGSFDYMAPERFLERPVDARTDVYALTCVLFECLTGRRPFTGDGLAKMMYAHLNSTPPPASSLRGGLPPALDGVLARGLAKDPDQRWPSAGALAQAARAALTSGGVAPQPEAVRPPGPSQPLPRPQAVGFSDPGPAGVWGGPSAPGTPLPPVGQQQPPPHWTPPPQLPPRPAPRPSRRWVPAAAAAVAAVAVAGVVAVVVTQGGDEPTPPTPTSSSTAPSTSPEQAALIALLPGGLADCTPVPTTDSGQVAGLTCGPSPVQPGPQEADVRQYTGEQDADARFLSVVDDQELEPLSSDQDCPGDIGYKYVTSDGQTSGRIGCYLTTRQDAVLFWSENASSTVTVVTVPGGGRDGLDDLYDWWSEPDNSRFAD